MLPSVWFRQVEEFPPLPQSQDCNIAVTAVKNCTGVPFLKETFVKGHYHEAFSACSQERHTFLREKLSAIVRGAYSDFRGRQ